MSESDRLNSGEQLVVGQRLVSKNARYVLDFQGDGNLVLKASGNIPVWNTGTHARNASVALMHDDGSFVMYTPGNSEVFNTGTSGHPGSILKLQDDRNLVVISPGNNPVWNSGTRLNDLTGQHQVVAAYFPIFGRGDRNSGTGFRWWIMKGNQKVLYIGDPDKNYPKLGLYGNKAKEDYQVIEFDFQSMASAGITAANLHLFGMHLENPPRATLSQETLSLLDCIDKNARAAGMMWTPTFESHEFDPVGSAPLISAIISRYGDRSLMKLDDDPVFFVTARIPHEIPDPTPKDINRYANAVAQMVELVREEHGRVHFILDADNCRLGQVCQVAGGRGNPSPWFLDPDNRGPGMPRISGFYNWQPVHWAKNAPNRRDYAKKYVERSANYNKVPVLSTLPSFDSNNFLDTPAFVYNDNRDLYEWKNNLDDVLFGSNGKTWLYIQAYDEWGEGSTLAPTMQQGFAFLEELRRGLKRNNWLNGSEVYVPPSVPELD